MFTQRKGDGHNSDLSLGLKLTVNILVNVLTTANINKTGNVQYPFILLSSAGCSASKDNSQGQIHKASQYKELFLVMKF